MWFCLKFHRFQTFWSFSKGKLQVKNGKIVKVIQTKVPAPSGKSKSKSKSEKITKVRLTDKKIRVFYSCTFMLF